jgi:hypothetical protein
VRIWSPVLSALPTPVGFSDFAVSDETGVGPALEVPEGAVRFLERPGYPSPEPPLEREASGPSWRVSVAMAAAEPPVIEGATWREFDGLRFEVTDGLSREDLEKIEIPGDLSRIDDGIWEVTAWLDFDDAGSVSHVFLEKATEDAERNRDLVRSLYQWKLQPEAAARRGRVKVLHTRRVTAADDANGAAP